MEPEDEPLGMRLCGWNKRTTRLLEKPGPQSWYIIDEPLCEAIASIPLPSSSNDNNDGSSSDQSYPTSTAELINQEISRGGLLNKFKQARTTSEVKVDRLLAILGKNIVAKSKQSSTVHQSEPNSNSLGGNEHNETVRGDLSFFISRTERREESFAGKFPNLTKLIEKLEATVQTELPEIVLDTQSTSVQVAEYPGDGTSGYPRHCDRTQCSHEPTTDVNDGTTTTERIITAVYYLTDEDWDATLDGGALRLFHSSPNTNDDSFTDVIPYPNRLVVFRSDSIEHQVLPSLRRVRRAITVWLYGTIKSEPDAIHKTTETATTLQSAPETDIKKLASNSNSNEEEKETRNQTSRDEQKDPLPPLPVEPSVQPTSVEDTIFVSIAAFRDSETGPTIQHLFDQAKNPKSVFVGVVLQVEDLKKNKYDREQVVGRLPTKEWWYKDHVRILQLDAQISSGPCPARAMAQILHRGERYLLQTDSHMRFRKNWDIYLIRQLTLNCPNPRYSLLTTYPVGYNLLPDSDGDSKVGASFFVKDNETRGTKLVPWKFDKDGFLRQKGQLLSDAVSEGGKPVLSQLFAAGFCFGMSEWMIQDVPYESLHHLFFGEEQSMAARLFTHGYDMYAPAESVCYHLWTRSHRPPPPTVQALDGEHSIEKDGHLPVQQRAQNLRLKSQRHVRSQLEDGSSLLGPKRTVRDWGQALGVDFESQTIQNASNELQCGGENEGLAVTTGRLSGDNVLDDKVMNRIQAFLQS